MRMRRARPGILVNPEGRVLCLSLRADATTEHECGIERIARAFGLPDTKSDIFGVERRRMREIPDNLRWIKFQSERFHTDTGKREPVVAEGFGFNVRDRTRDYARDHELTFSSWIDTPEWSLAGGWSDEEFAVVACEPAQVASLKEVWNGIWDGRVMLGGTDLPREYGGGFLLSFIDRLPEGVAAQMAESDRRKYAARTAFEASGITQELRAAGKHWFALSRPEFGPDGILRVWLNPYDQKAYEFGWYTIEELRAWARNEGPVMKRRTA